MRSYNHTAGAVSAWKGVKHIAAVIANNTLCVYPNPVDNKLILTKYHVHEYVGGTERGVMPGLLNCMQYTTNRLAGNKRVGTYISNVDGYAGRTFAVMTNIYSTSDFVPFLIDITGPWETF